MFDNGELTLGPCGTCGKTGPEVRNIGMLSQKAPVPGTGWGCLLCGLPSDGALYVQCDTCLEAEASPRFICHGLVSSHGRAPIEMLAPDIFEHDMDKHAAFDGEGDHLHPAVTCIRCNGFVDLGDDPGAEGSQWYEPNQVCRWKTGAAMSGPGAMYCATCAPTVKFCEVCGCTDESGCEGGCYWLTNFKGEVTNRCSCCLTKEIPHAPA